MDELQDVVVDAPAFLDRRNDGGEIVVRDHHVRDFFGDVGAGDAHRDADIRFFDGRGVIHAVARHRDDLMAAAPRPDDPQLVLRRDAGVHGDLVYLLFELLLAELVQLLAGQGQRVLLEEAQLSGNRGGGILVVARDHNRLDAGRDALLDRLLDLLPRRIDHRNQADEGQVPFDGGRVEPARYAIQLAVRYAQDSHGLSGQVVIGGRDLFSVLSR